MINRIKKCDKFQLFLLCYLILNVLYLVVGMYISKINNLNYQIFSYGLIFFLFINLLIFSFIIIKKKYIKNTIDYFILLIMFFSIISTIFAFRFDYALLGFKNRYEGLLQILYYLTLFLITTFLDKKNKKIVINAILLTGLVHLYFAYNQYLYKKSLMTIGTVWFDIIKGLTTNSNFLGTYFLICLCYSIGNFIKENILYKRIIYLVITLLFIYGLLLTNALSSVVGLIFVLIVLFVYCLKNKKKILYLVVITLLVILSLFMNNNNSTKILKDLEKTFNQTSSIIKGNIDDSYGTNRIYIWKNTIRIIPKNIIHGVGIDNFYYAFDGKPLVKVGKNTKYDKAHNEYLQILITEGIFSLLSYLGFYFLIIINVFKHKNIYMLLPVIGYLVQAFFNISVIEVAPLFYISCGLLYERKSVEKNVEKSYN